MIHNVTFIIICGDFHINYVIILTLMIVYYYCLINVRFINVISHLLVINHFGNDLFDLLIWDCYVLLNLDSYIIHILIVKIIKSVLIDFRHKLYNLIFFYLSIFQHVDMVLQWMFQDIIYS